MIVWALPVMDLGQRIAEMPGRVRGITPVANDDGVMLIKWWVRVIRLHEASREFIGSLAAGNGDVAEDDFHSAKTS